MTSTLFIVIAVAFSNNTIAQSSLKKDSIIYQKRDIYDNFQIHQNAYPYFQTFAADSLGNRINQPGLPIQQLNYEQLTRKADSFFMLRQFSAAVKLYMIAFKNNSDRGQVAHRYKAACCYTQLNEADSAFEQLFRIADKGNYYNYIEIQDERYLMPLQKDNRWTTLLKLIKSNAEKIQQKLNAEIPPKS